MEAFAYRLLTDESREDNEVLPLGDVVTNFFKTRITQVRVRAGATVGVRVRIRVGVGVRVRP